MKSILFMLTGLLLCTAACSSDKGSDTAPGSGSDWDQDTETVEPMTPGTVVNFLTESLPGDEPTACEWEWTVRILMYSPGAEVPRRMYQSACNTDSATPDMFVSLTVGQNAAHPEEDPTSGAIIRTRLSETTGELEVVDSRRFEECQEMHGIATSADCSTVAALCRIASGTPGADGDPLSEHSAWDWMTNPVVCGDDKLNDEMWLYEWTDGDLQSAPKRYIVHKSIGSWEYGNNYLVYGENDNSYGIAVKATVGETNACHEADAFLILDRSDYSLAEDRGWTWACATGHTLFNRPAYNAGSKKYAMMCSTDYNEAEIGGLGAVAFRLEDGPTREFHYVNVDGIANKGGASVVLPEGDDGFMGLLVGVDEPIKPEGYPELPPTSIGLAHFNASGEIVGQVRKVVSDENAYLSYPQLVKLAQDRYLLGYGVMHPVNAPDNSSGMSHRIPYEYWVVEINAQGQFLTSPQKLENTGWGEQDQIVNLGHGRAAWAYIPDPTLPEPPSCNSDTLQFSVYSMSE